MNKTLCREPLASGGELAIYESGCRIEYFFAGPDGRYGGVHINIPGSRVEEYMEAWIANYERYESLGGGCGKEPVKAETGKCGMLIRTGFGQGVYLQGNHMRISTRKQLEQVVEDYKYVMQKGIETNRQ